MRRGEIRLVDFEPTRGSEANKRRPAVLISNDASNRVAERLGRGVVTVLPLTSRITRIYPFQVLLHPEQGGLRRPSKVQAEQIRAVDIRRVGPRLGVVPPDVMEAIELAIRIHLDV